MTGYGTLKIELFLNSTQTGKYIRPVTIHTIRGLTHTEAQAAYNEFKLANDLNVHATFHPDTIHLDY